MPQPKEIDFGEVTGVLSTLPLEIGAQMDAHGHVWKPDSRAAAEAAEFPPDSQAVLTAYNLAEQAWTQAGDHMSALERSLTDDVMTFAPWTLARAVLEAAARAWWLLDPAADARGRVARGMLWRLKSLEELHKFASRPAPGDPERARLQERAQERMASIREQEGQLGVRLNRDKRGRALLPPVTRMADDAFDTGWVYSLLSAAIHGRPWATLNLSMTRIDGAPVIPGTQAVQQGIAVQDALLLVFWSIEWLAQPTWLYFKHCGWDLDQLAATLDTAYDTAHMAQRTRFWRDR